MVGAHCAHHRAPRGAHRSPRGERSPTGEHHTPRGAWSADREAGLPPRREPGSRPSSTRMDPSTSLHKAKGEMPYPCHNLPQPQRKPLPTGALAATVKANLRKKGYDSAALLLRLCAAQPMWHIGPLERRLAPLELHRRTVQVWWPGRTGQTTTAPRGTPPRAVCHTGYYTGSSPLGVDPRGLATPDPPDPGVPVDRHMAA